MARHPHHALTNARINAIKEPGRYADGNGLYLVVDDSGAKRWLLRIVIKRRRRDIGLQSYRLVSLAEARETARHMRAIARKGGDPLAERRAAQRTAPTFAEAAKAVHEEHKKSWKNEKHQAQWINTLTEYAFPVLGNLDVDQIDTPDVMRALGPIWLEKPETARRIRQRIGFVMDWAKARGFRDRPNPVEGVGKALPRQTSGQKHHTALPYVQIPKLIEDLRASAASETARLALELLILTATRTGEVLGTKLEEIDFENAVWTIPGSRMKAGAEHRVPLSARALEICRQAKEAMPDDELLFSGRTPGKPLSNMVFLMTLRRMKYAVTAHGFRSAFRDWTAERTNFTREVCEAALAHTVINKTEAAYRRTDLFERRRDLMALWGQFATEKLGSILQLKRA